MSKNSKTVPTQNYDEIVSTVSKYVEGLRVGSVDGVAEAFHKDASPMASCSGARSRTSTTVGFRPHCPRILLWRKH